MIGKSVSGDDNIHEDSDIWVWNEIQYDKQILKVTKLTTNKWNQPFLTRVMTFTSEMDLSGFTIFLAFDWFLDDRSPLLFDNLKTIIVRNRK